MNSNALVQIFVAIIAAFPALISIFSTFIKPYAQKSFDLSVGIFVRVLQIQRKPFDEKEWLFLRKQYIIDIITPLFVLIVIASITLLVKVVWQINQLLSVLSFCVASLYILPCVYSLLRYINLGNNPRDSRYLLFKEASIEIQADYESLFDHVQAVLGYLNAKASEVDFDTKSFSAYVGSKIFYQKINIDIQSQEEQRQLMSISFSSKFFQYRQLERNTHTTDDYQCCDSLGMKKDQLLRDDATQGLSNESCLPISEMVKNGDQIFDNFTNREYLPYRLGEPMSTYIPCQNPVLLCNNRNLGIEHVMIY